MQERSGDERGERARRRLSGSVLALVSLIAVVAGIGIVLSLGRHPAAPSPEANGSLPLINATPAATVGAPQSGALFSVADDLATHEVVLFGGVDDWDNTWIWNGTAWTQVQPAVSPPGRFGASAAYDPETKMVMLFGGRTEPGTPVHDTWGWNGTVWQDLDSGAGGPAPGEGSDMAWDKALSQMVLTTSSGVIGAPGATWVWAGTHWSEPAGGDLPSGAFYSPMWFDPTTQWLIAVACCEDRPPVSGAVNTTWRWDGFKWSLLSTPDDSPHDASTMALDPAINSLVLCTCDSAVAGDPELLVWYRSGWISRTAARLPVEGGVEITDADRHQLLLLGSPPSATASAALPVEVWSLTGSTWTRIDRPGSG
jgi:hypothetical protein